MSRIKINLNYQLPMSPQPIEEDKEIELKSHTISIEVDPTEKSDTQHTFSQLIEEHLPQIKNQLVAVKINDKVMDLSTTLSEELLSQQQNFEILSIFDKFGIDVVRHTTTHVMAYAIQRLQPKLQVTIGPVIEDGFFYDIDNIEIKQDDFKTIEEEMAKIIQEKHQNIRVEMSRDDALKFFADNPYKQEVISEISSDETITCYKMGDFTDLCRGPHLPHTGMIKAFKLIRLAGAYWRGNSENKMLTRIYGTSFADKKQLKDYLSRLENAKKRDHNKVGRDMGIFTSNELVGQGLPLLTTNGTTLKNTLQRFVEDTERKLGYEFTQTPYLSKSDLFKVSGHWDHYKESMFVIEDENDTLALRPMTCPFHFCIYNAQRRSYRELPVKYAETSVLFRNEASGEMHGLTRLRQFTLSDGHVICTEDQIAEQFKECLELSEYYLKTLNLKNYWFRFSKWDSTDKEKYVDKPEAWEFTQNKMKLILDQLGVNYIEADGEAAFYGPKLDLQMKNVYGKEDTIMTVQLDFGLPEKFKMKYIDANDQEQTPYVIHRGSLGCYERTMALIIEEYEGRFPFWLAPEQVVILTINEDSHDYAQEINKKMLDHDLRCKLDLRSESLNRKVRDAQLKKISLIVTVGKNEKADRTVSVRTLSGNIKMNIALVDFINQCLEMNHKKTFENHFDEN